MGGDVSTAVALGHSPACGEWHMLEAVLVDEEGWRLENSEAEAAVRFHFSCDGSDAETDSSEAEAKRRAEAFTGIYDNFGWEPPEGTKETRSGPGSYLSRTATSREFVGRVLAEFGVASMLDAGCGDVNWQRHIPGIDKVRYVGVDIVAELIEGNRRALSGRENMSFAVLDVVSEPLPGRFDLVMCRDTLFHLPLFDAVQALRNIDASGSRFLLSHYDEDLAHNWPDIKAGEWHVINLLAAPFKLPPPLLSVPETGDEGTVRSASHYGSSRRLALWALPVLPAPVPAPRWPSALSGLGVGRRCLLLGAHSPAPPAVAPFDLVICLGTAPHSYVECNVRVTAQPTDREGSGEVVVEAEGGEAGEGVSGLQAAGAMGCAVALLLSDAAPDSDHRPGTALDQAASALWQNGVYVFGASEEEGGWSGPVSGHMLPVLSVNAFASPAFPPPDASHHTPRVLCVVPARFGSQRLGGKLLRELKGESVLRRTLRQAQRAARCDMLTVATDDARIAAHVEEVGVQAVMTRGEWKSGTDRIYEAWRRTQHKTQTTFQVIVNVQGDEPLLDPTHVDAAAHTLINDPSAHMSTLAAPIHLQEAQSQAVVKVVTDAYGAALYFSRALIPSTKPSSPPPPDATFKRHIGIYAFRSSFLETYVTLPFSHLQASEDLEQLKVLSAGFKLQVAMVDKAQPDVNTEEDLKLLETLV